MTDLPRSLQGALIFAAVGLIITGNRAVSGVFNYDGWAYYAAGLILLAAWAVIKYQNFYGLIASGMVLGAGAILYFA